MDGGDEFSKMSCQGKLAVGQALNPPLIQPLVKGGFGGISVWLIYSMDTIDVCKFLG